MVNFEKRRGQIPVGKKISYNTTKLKCTGVGNLILFATT